MNTTTKVITSVIGILLAFAGFEHGLFEILQGNRPTSGYFIQGIGEDMQWWEHGSEDAFTLIPNYLFTGICAVSISIFIIFWSIFFVQGKLGTTIFLFLFILLVAVGGGIGFIPFFLVTWAYATRINKSLNWWRKILVPKVRKTLANIWTYALILTALCWLIAIEIAIFGYSPIQTEPDVLLNICWSFLLITMIFINLSFVSGFAHDLEKQIN